MGLETGLTRYTCDRCGTKQIITEKQAKEEKWAFVTFKRANQSDDTRLLCGYCLTDWNGYMPKADTIFDNFMDKK